MVLPSGKVTNRIHKMGYPQMLDGFWRTISPRKMTFHRVKRGWSSWFRGSNSAKSKQEDVIITLTWSPVNITTDMFWCHQIFTECERNIPGDSATDINCAEIYKPFWLFQERILDNGSQLLTSNFQKNSAKNQLANSSGTMTRVPPGSLPSCCVSSLRSRSLQLRAGDKPCLSDSLGSAAPFLFFFPWAVLMSKHQITVVGKTNPAWNNKNSWALEKEDFVEIWGTCQLWDYTLKSRRYKTGVRYQHAKEWSETNWTQQNYRTINFSNGTQKLRTKICLFHPNRTGKLLKYVNCPKWYRNEVARIFWYPMILHDFMGVVPLSSPTFHWSIALLVIWSDFWELIHDVPQWNIPVQPLCFMDMVWQQPEKLSSHQPEKKS